MKGSSERESNRNTELVKELWKRELWKRELGRRGLELERLKRDLELERRERRERRELELELELELKRVRRRERERELEREWRERELERERRLELEQERELWGLLVKKLFAAASGLLHWQPAGDRVAFESVAKRLTQVAHRVLPRKVHIDFDSATADLLCEFYEQPNPTRWTLAYFTLKHVSYIPLTFLAYLKGQLELAARRLFW